MEITPPPPLCIPSQNHIFLKVSVGSQALSRGLLTLDSTFFWLNYLSLQGLDLISISGLHLALGVLLTAAFPHFYLQVF